MFDNFVNFRDLTNLRKLLSPHRCWAFASRLARSGTRQVQQVWATVERPPTNWWDIPAVLERWNVLISGQATVDPQTYFVSKYLQGRDALTALSLGCGTGHRELRWAATGKFQKIVGIDLSDQRIERAIRLAHESGDTGILQYRVGNVVDGQWPAGAYNLVLAEQSLHHFSPLTDVLESIRRLLRPGGYFVVNEYVGPTRFQWTDRQIEVVNSLLGVLPASYRVRWDGSLKSRVHRPSRLSMILSDPSEAIESASILPLLSRMFEVVESKPYGGTILHLLFQGIAHHFLGQNPSVQKWLRLCFEVEDLLLESGELKSDFMFLVCKHRPVNS